MRECISPLFLAAGAAAPGYTPIVEYIFAAAMITQGVLAWCWIRLYKSVFRQLSARHPAKFTVLWGSPERRRNSVDRLFAFIQFLQASDDRLLKDRAITRSCVLIKLCSAAFLAAFLVMSFSPMFLPAGR